MDFGKFDNDADESDENYFSYVAWLSKLTAADLQSVKGNAQQQKLALCRYYKRGERANLTASHLIDLLGVSSPSILDIADYTDEGEAIFVISDSLTDDDIRQEVLQDM